MRVVAAMSGGVDSAVAAARMVDAGHEVVGVHLALSQNAATLRESARGCCTIEDAGDARRVADVLGIPFYVWDLAARFREDVVEDFLAEYAAGRTPNPCVRCNERIKFAALLDKAVALGFDAVATGHYAQVVERPDGGGSCTAPSTRRRTSPTSWGSSTRTSCPARSSRSATRPSRRSARRPRPAASTSRASRTATTSASSRTATPAGSSAGRLGEQPGDLVDTEGTVVGSHSGAYGFTVGQRRGLGLDRGGLDGEPRFVVGVEARTNTVVIGTRDLLGVDAIVGGHARWCGPAPDGVVEVGAQLRAHGEEYAATAWADGDTVHVRLAERARGVAPGQSVVLYAGTRVVGSATIQEAFAAPATP